jgi:hypothetical protein
MLRKTELGHFCPNERKARKKGLGINQENLKISVKRLLRFTTQSCGQECPRSFCCPNQLLLFFILLTVSANAQKLTADLVVINANVHTIDNKNPRAEAFAIKENKIIAVGKTSEIRALIGENTRTIDAEEKTVIPGFNDSHVHFFSIGNQFFSIDLSKVRTPQETIEKIKHYVRFLPKGQWILGGAWNNENWTPNDLPTKDLIDAATPEHPVFIYNANPQIALVNSLALKIAGIDKTTKEISVGEIVRNATGEPNGILKGNAISLVRKLVPLAATKNKLAVAETATNYAASWGVTSVQDVHSDDEIEILRELVRQNKLKTRIYDCLPLYDWRKLFNRNIRRATGDAMLRQGCLKHFSDGNVDDIPELFKEISSADKADLQVVMHAIGNRANDVVLTIYERVLKENGTKDRRFRIEHAHNFRLSDLKRFANTKTITSMQPFLFYYGQNTEPYRQLLDAGGLLAFGSDAAIIDLNPFDGIFAAVKNNFSVEEAVRAYTLDAAYAEFQENIKGTISVGKLADFIILSHDIFKINANGIRQTKVLMTIMDGKIVYQAK